MRTEEEIKTRLALATKRVNKYLNEGNDKHHLVWRTVEKELQWVIGEGTYGINSKTINKRRRNGRV